MTPSFLRPVLFMYERFFPPGFHAGSTGSVGPGEDDDGREDDMMAKVGGREITAIQSSSKLWAHFHFYTSKSSLRVQDTAKSSFIDNSIKSCPI